MEPACTIIIQRIHVMHQCINLRLHALIKTWKNTYLSSAPNKALETPLEQCKEPCLLKVVTLLQIIHYTLQKFPLPSQIYSPENTCNLHFNWQWEDPQ